MARTSQKLKRPASEPVEPRKPISRKRAQAIAPLKDKEKAVACFLYIRRLLETEGGHEPRTSISRKRAQAIALLERKKQIKALADEWGTAGIPLYQGFCFRTIQCVREALGALQQARENIAPNRTVSAKALVGDALPQEVRRAIQHDWRAFICLQQHVERIRLHSDLGKDIFGPVIETFRKQSPQTHMVHAGKAFMSHVTDDPKHPGSGLPGIVQQQHGVILLRQETMKEEIFRAAGALHKRLCRDPRQCPLDHITDLIHRTIRVLAIPYRYGKTDDPKALRELLRPRLHAPPSR